MVNRCFSSSLLYALRNQIRIDVLIEKMLHIPCRMTKGCFRFLCPLCSGFDTAVNPKTNLARCFQCGKNYNTIDLVMLTRQADFVHSVKWLQSIHQKEDIDHSHLDNNTISPSNRPHTKAPSKRGPQAIGEVIHDVLSPIGGIAEYRKDTSKVGRQITVLNKSVENRIVALERKIELLDAQIEEIA